MKTVSQKVEGFLYKTALANPGGIQVPVSIQRAFAVGVPTEDVTAQSFEPDTMQQPEGFLIIPLKAGTVKVHLVGASTFEDYTISEAEISAWIGKPTPYLVDKVYKDGTTAELNIGW